MKLTNIIFNNTNEGNPSLREDFEKTLTVLAENFAIAMAEAKRWQSIEEVSGEALSEGMHLLDIKELRTSFCIFRRLGENLEVEYERREIH